MVLAGAILKMGGYGVYRLCFCVVKSSGAKFFFVRGMLISTFLCFLQRDLKSLVAFSRIGHITLAILGIFFLSKFSFKGAIILILIHGIFSPLIFFSVNYFYYSSLRRAFYLGQKRLKKNKILRISFFLIFVNILNFPPLIGFWGEFLLMLRLTFYFLYSLTFIFFLVIFSCYYTIFFLLNLFFSKEKEEEKT